MRSDQTAYVKCALQPIDAKSVKYMMLFLLSVKESIPETTSSNQKAPTRINEDLTSRELKFLIFAQILLHKNVADVRSRQLIWLVANKLRL